MDKPVVLYDGVCNLCSGVVKFVINHDPKHTLNFASLQSETGKKLLKANNLESKAFDSFVFIKNGKAATHSTAALKLAQSLGFPWNLAYMFIIVPTPARDAIYWFLARNRYKWFGKKDSCMMPGENIKKRFLDW
jgi:predicted DCC family thiol-disulfide oxidoreductase YuxK